MTGGSDEKPMTIGKTSCVRGKSRIGNKRRYVHRVIMARGHKNILICEPASTHAPNTMVRLQTRMVDIESSNTLDGA